MHDWLKFFHILSATVLLTSLASCCFYWWHKVPTYSDRIQNQTWYIILPAALIQLFSGFTMISVKHYSMSEIWILVSATGFVLLIVEWFGFIYSLCLEKQTKLIRNFQASLLIAGLLTILLMIFFMTNRIVTIYA